MHQVTARHNVSPGDCEVIWHLAHTDSSEHTPGQLAKAFQVTAGTMTSRLDRLERAGYLSRSIVPGVPVPSKRSWKTIRLALP
jgi:DNA-binding MarR family transcriptional regulator